MWVWYTSGKSFAADLYFLGLFSRCHTCVCMCVCVHMCVHACVCVCVCVCAHACVCAVEFLLLKSVGARGLCKCLGLLQIRCVKCLLLLLLYLLTSLSPHLDPSVVYLEAMVWEWSEWQIHFLLEEYYQAYCRFCMVVAFMNKIKHTMFCGDFSMYII